MIFKDICLMTDDVLNLCSFYEKIFGVPYEGDEIHSTLNLPGICLAIYNKTAAENTMGFNFSSAGTGSYTLGFNCEDADIEYERIKSHNICNPSKPQTWPWGAKSFRFTDPDGNIIMIRSWPKNDYKD